MSNRDTIREALIQYLREDTPVGTKAVADSTDLHRQLRLDSVDYVGVIMRLEGRFRVRMTQSEIAQISTVGELLDLIESKCRIAVAA